MDWDPKTELLNKDTRIAQLEQDIEKLLDEQLDAEGALRFRIKELEAKLEQAVFGPPAQMTFRGKLVPINSTGMREVIDYAGQLEQQLAAAARREAAMRRNIRASDPMHRVDL